MLHDCPVCGGLRPALRACPHCDAPVGRWPRLARSIAGLLGAGAAAVTLMACYGAPPGYYRPDPHPGCEDADGDGSLVCPDHTRSAPIDCDDHDRMVYPGAADEDGNGIDENCDGVDGWADPNAVAAPAPDAAPAPPTP